MASVKQFQVTFDCAEPERVARFWCEVLGYVVPPPPDGFATWDDFDRSLPSERQGSAFACVDPSGVGPRLFFQRVPEGKVVKNRVHLDVRVGTGLVGEERVAALETECARLVALGAVRVRLLRADGFNESCLVMQDIEGNEFDLDWAAAPSLLSPPFSARPASPPRLSRTPAGPRASGRRAAPAPRTASAHAPPAWAARRTRTHRSVPAPPAPAEAACLPRTVRYPAAP